MPSLRRHQMASQNDNEIELDSAKKSAINQIHKRDLSTEKSLTKDRVQHIPDGDDNSSEDDLPLGVLSRRSYEKNKGLRNESNGMLTRRRSSYDRSKIVSESHGNVIQTLNKPEPAEIKPSTRRKSCGQQNVSTNLLTSERGMALRSRALFQNETALKLPQRRRGRKRSSITYQDVMEKEMECDKPRRYEEMTVAHECISDIPRAENGNEEQISSKISTNARRSADNVEALLPNEVSNDTISESVGENVELKENIKPSESRPTNTVTEALCDVSGIGDTVADESVRTANDSLQGGTDVPQNCGGTPLASAQLSDPSSVAEGSRKVSFSEIPQTPTSASGRRIMSRGQLILSRSRPLFSMRNHKTLMMSSEGCTESPRAGFVSGRTSGREAASPLVINQGVGHPCLFSPIDSPSAGILRKKRLHDETQPEDSPFSPHKKRRVSFSNKIDTVEIPNRFQQRLLNIKQEYQSSPLRQVNRQLEMPSSSVNSTATSALASRILNSLYSKNGLAESMSTTESRDFDATKVLEDIYPLDGDPQLSNDDHRTLTMTRKSQISCTDPVFPDLISCTLPVDLILHKLTQTLWRTGLKQLLHAKNIKTIGSLCSLTEVEVHNLPIVQPKLQNLKEVLRTFAKSVQWPSNVTDESNQIQLDVASIEKDGLQLLEEGTKNPSDYPCDETEDPTEDTIICVANFGTTNQDSECISPNEAITCVTKKERNFASQLPTDTSLADICVQEEVKAEEISENTDVCVEPDDVKKLEDLYNVIFSKKLTREHTHQIMKLSLKVVNTCCQMLESDSATIIRH